MSEARLDRIEEDVRDIKATLRDLAPLIVRIDERLRRRQGMRARNRGNVAPLACSMSRAIGEICLR